MTGAGQGPGACQGDTMSLERFLTRTAAVNPTFLLCTETDISNLC